MSGGKVIVITGTTSGIGSELKRLYESRGDTVVGIARKAAPPDFAADVTDAGEMERVFSEIGNAYGRIDTVIANAGGGLSGATELLTDEQIENQIELNFTGALRTVRCALRYMQKGGRVVFISSACALFALPFRAMYCASKSAVNMAAYGLYMELKAYGIKVCTVCPGDIKTGFTANRVKNSAGGERYGDRPAECAQKIDSREDKRMSLKSAGKKIFKCCNKCNKPLYIVGAKYKVLYFLQRLLPTKLFLAATLKLFG